MQTRAFGLLVLLSASACKESAEQKAAAQAAANEKVCAKIESFAQGQTSPAQKDRCLGEILALGPNARACFDPCIEKSKDRIDYEICKDECTSRSGLAAATCARGYPWDEGGNTACTTALVPLQTSDRAKLACVTRCQHEDGARGIHVCAQKCNAPVLPAPKTPAHEAAAVTVTAPTASAPPRAAPNLGGNGKAPSLGF